MRKGETRNERCEEVKTSTNGISFISFRPWGERLLQGTTLRNLDGDPLKPFDLAGGTSPYTATISRNRVLFRESVAGPLSVVVSMEQVHGGRVEAVDRTGIGGRGAVEGELFVEGCDGLITNVSDVMLTARVADCVPVFLYDGVNGAIGLLHAGWRGTAVGILPVAVGRMKVEYGSEPRDLEIYLGPSIEKTCYPVGRDVYRQFDKWNDDGLGADEEWQVDLQDINRRQAIAEGIPEDNVSVTRYCTVCSANMLYSHRASEGEGGRMLAFIALRKQISP